MATEIERKFLVSGQPWTRYSSTSRVINQGYLCCDPQSTVRVRTVGQVGYVTIKGVTAGMSRPEFEYAIPHSDACEMMHLCGGATINKTRHMFTDEHYQFWEVDQFHGKLEGLIVAEIELSSEQDTVILPDWIVKEVTSDIRYYNSNLSTGVTLGELNEEIGVLDRHVQ